MKSELKAEDKEQLFEKAKTDHRLLRKLKMLAVHNQMYELGSQLRAMENELFPENEETKKAMQEAKNMNLLFRMVGLNVAEDTCWLISEAIKAHRKKKGKFSVDDAAKIKHKYNQMFDEKLPI